AHRAAYSRPRPELRIAHGKGRFGRQVANGAEAYAREVGCRRVSTGPADAMLSNELAGEWILFTAGTFEEDIETVARVRGLGRPPRLTCAVAAGVQAFGDVVQSPDGIFGIAQWFPGSG